MKQLLTISAICFAGLTFSQSINVKDGNEKFSTEIVASDMQMLGGRGAAGGGGAPGGSGGERGGASYGGGGGSRNDSAPRGQAPSCWVIFAPLGMVHRNCVASSS